MQRLRYTLVAFGVLGFCAWSFFWALLFLFDGWGGNKIPLTDGQKQFIWAGPCIAFVYYISHAFWRGRGRVQMWVGGLLHVPFVASAIALLIYHTMLAFFLGVPLAIGPALWMTYAFYDEQATPNDAS